MLPQKDKAALTKILALLGSDKAGERDAAVCAAQRVLDRNGLCWPDLLGLPQPPQPPKREPLFATWRATCAELSRRQRDLRPWERAFVADLPAFPRISTKQRYVLKQIADRVLGARAR